MVPITTNPKAIKACYKLIEVFKEVHGDKYDYSRALYVKGHTPITIGCPIHGDFQQEPNSHRAGRGCPKCGLERRGIEHRSTTEAFIKKAKSVHGEFAYTYENTKYTIAKNNLIVTCPKHGDFTIRGDHFLNGSGCPSCTVNGFNKSLPAILYYLSINGGVAYKIGVTNNDVTIRFSAEELKTITVLATWTYTIGEEAYNEEQRILNEFSDMRYKGPALLKAGNTELFHSDILNLDKRT